MFFCSLSGRMDYPECHFGPSCTCDHRPPFVHGVSPNFPPLHNRSCEVVPPHSSVSYTNKKEHSDGVIPKRTKSNQGSVCFVLCVVTGAGMAQYVVRALTSSQCRPGFNTETQCHMWVEFVFGSRPCF